MAKENVSLDFRLRKIEDVRNYLLEEIKKKNESMSKKHKKLCRISNYFEHFPIFISADSGCVLISAFLSFSSFISGISVGNTFVQ